MFKNTLGRTDENKDLIDEVKEDEDFFFKFNQQNEMAETSIKLAKSHSGERLHNKD